MKEAGQSVIKLGEAIRMEDNRGQKTVSLGAF